MITAWMWDALVVLLFLVFVVLGFKKGFIRSISKVASFLLALVATLLFGTRLEEWFKGTEAFSRLSGQVEKWLGMEQAVTNAATQSQPAASNGAMPEVIRNIISRQTEAVESGLNAVLTELYEQISVILFHILFFIVLWFVIKLLLRFATAILDRIARLPILSSLNGLLGAVVGFIKGWLVVSAVCLLLMLFSGNATVAGWIKTIPDTYVMSVCYNQNILISVFQ